MSVPLPPPVWPRSRVLRMSSRATKPSNSSDFSFELRALDRQSRLNILRKALFSPKLWTLSIRYGSRNLNVLSCLRTSAERGSATSLGQVRASNFEFVIKRAISARLVRRRQRRLRCRAPRRRRRLAPSPTMLDPAPQRCRRVAVACQSFRSNGARSSYPRTRESATAVC